MTTADALAIGAEIEAVLAHVSRSEPAAAAQAQRLTSLLMSFYEAGLSRVLEIVRADAQGEALLERLRSDPLVGNLLALHDLVPTRDLRLIQITQPAAHGADRAAGGDERCELCGVAIAGAHGHLVDLDSRRLLCACLVCGTIGGRYRLVPSRYVHSSAMRLTQAQWEPLGLPVGLVFFVALSRLDRTVACNPGPAGATESLLSLEAWPALAAEHPWVGDLAPDVEALLVRRVGDHYDCYIVPIDACYELVGRIRRTWTGLGGGAAVSAELERFFASVVEKSKRGGAPSA